jgi:hypothetical protein
MLENKHKCSHWQSRCLHWIFFIVHSDIVHDNCAMTLSIKPFSIMALSIKGLFVTLSIILLMSIKWSNLQKSKFTPKQFYEINSMFTASSKHYIKISPLFCWNKQHCSLYDAKTWSIVTLSIAIKHDTQNNDCQHKDTSCWV